MNIFKLAVELFIIYMVYKLIFDFIIPVYRTTRHVKQKMSEMQRQMQEREDLNNPIHKNNSTQPQASQKPYSDDYIEYEEIK